MARLWRLLQQLSTKENQKVEETVSGTERYETLMFPRNQLSHTNNYNK